MQLIGIVLLRRVRDGKMWIPNIVISSRNLYHYKAGHGYLNQTVLMETVYSRAFSILPASTRARCEVDKVCWIVHIETEIGSKTGESVLFCSRHFFEMLTGVATVC
jgi:hypothetical protein